MSGRLRPSVAAVAVAALLPLIPSLAAVAPAHAAVTEERVIKDDVTLTFDSSGMLHANETIVYDFTGGSGMERSFVTRIPDNDTRDRIFKITSIHASSPDGGPSTVSVSSDTNRTYVKVTGAGSINGRHTVVLSYDVLGAITDLNGGQELRWTSVNGWSVPVVQATTTVDSSAPIRSLSCFEGDLSSSIGCTRFYLADHVQTRGQFAQLNMLPGETFTVVVDYPPGTAMALPLYEHRHTLSTAFTVNSLTGSALLALLVLLLGGFGLLYQLRGRDARSVTRRAAAADQAASLTGTTADFEPPNGVRPGQIGTLIDEQADVIDVTATIVDLAVRGYLMIEEENRETTGRLDWRLVKLQRPAPDLLPYEQLLYQALFDGRTSIGLSELSGTFAGNLAKVRAAMYDDVVSQGWFARRPDTVRTHWTTAGYIITGLGVLGTVALALYTELALVGLAVIIAGAAMAIGGRYMPAKTSRGSTVLAHTIGFRSHLVRGETPPGVAEAQRIAIFSRFLPYAVVFDCIGPWSKTVEDSGIKAEGADNLYWYDGPAEWDLAKFGESMRASTTAASGAISQSRQSRSLA